MHRLKTATTLATTLTLAALLSLAAGCGDDGAPTENAVSTPFDEAAPAEINGDAHDHDHDHEHEPGHTHESAPADATAAKPAPANALTPEKLHAKLKAANPGYADGGQFQFDAEGNIAAVDLRDAAIADISPLKGMPLRAVFLEGTKVTDLSPLADMRLMQLALSNTPVSDLSPLRGMPLRELRLVRTKVTDIGALEGMPLEMLWLNDSPVESIGVLERTPIVSLTLKGTNVKDLSAVRTMPRLQRLHIAGTPVTDLRPLAKLPLKRLVFTPSNIKEGIMEVRRIGDMQQIGTMFGDPDSDLTDPVTFWKKYDEGAFK